MPIYEYACPDCGHKFELIQKFSDEPAKDCPHCKGGNVKKLVSLSAFQLQGGGWYKDHYGLKSGADTSSSTSGSKPAAKSTSDSASTASSTPAAAPAKPSSSGGSAPASS